MKSLVCCLFIISSLCSSSPAEADILAYWNFNNSNNDSDRLNATGDANDLPEFAHMYDSNSFEDGWYDPARHALYPVQNAPEPGLPGALIQNADPGLGSQQTETVFIDTSSINGDGLATNLGTPEGDWGSFVGTELNEPGIPFFGGSLAVQGAGNNGRSFTIHADLTGWRAIGLSWAQRGTDTGYSSRLVEVSTNGAMWSTVYFGAGTLDANWSVEAASIGAQLNNAPAALIRFTVDGATTDAGNNRFDNIVLTGIVVPEPSTMAVLAGLVFATGSIRRRA